MIDTERDDSRTPWTPAGLRLPRVGDRVRYHASAECWLDNESEVDMTDCRVADGRVGEVETTDDARAPGHPVVMRFDEPYMSADGWRRIWGHVCSLSELEILADDDGG